MQKVKLVRKWGKNKKGMILEVDDRRAEVLIKADIAEVIKTNESKP